MVYADDTLVAAMMVSNDEAAGTQRQRWENGRLQLIRAQTVPLLRRVFDTGDAVCLDLALDLMVAPLSYVVLNVVALILLAGMASLWDPSMKWWILVGFACTTCLMAYVLRGWQLSHVGLRGLIDLLRVPRFVLWKVLVMAQAHDSAEWIRTKRERP